MAHDRETNATGTPFSVDYRFRRADGTYVWIQDQASLIGPLDGERFWQGFMLDITQRKEAEAALAEAEERFRLLVEQVPVVIYTQAIDAEDPTLTNTIYISPRTEAMLGYTVEETIETGGLWRDLLHPDDRERVLEADAAGNASGENFQMDYRMIHRDGHVVWVHDEATVVTDAEGRPRFWQGFMLDITQRREAEERLERALDVEREATRRLRSLDEMKNTFLQAVSHDLRTPLAAILGLAVTLERGEIELPREEARDLARRIARNARRLDRLVRDLLDLDRLARGIVEPKRYPTDVGGLVRRIVEESDLVDGDRVTLDTPRVIAAVDASKVERIVENLLANTVRHTPGDTRVWVRVVPVDDGVRIAVEDDGPGVPQDLRETVFEPFRQGPDAPEHAPGVGVGLTLVRRFAELHGGRAWVEEREGGGASFRVELPARASTAPAWPPGEGSSAV
jgi:PAS domain S-box-containing protein